VHLGESLVKDLKGAQMGWPCPCSGGCRRIGSRPPSIVNEAEEGIACVNPTTGDGN